MMITGCAAVQRAAIGPPVVEVDARAIEAPPPRPRAPLRVPDGATRFALHPEGSRFQVRSGDLFGTYLSDFTRYHGLLAVAGPAAERGQIAIDIEMASLRSESKIVTAILQYEFLEIDDHPRARIEGTLRPTGRAPDERVVEGTLDLHGVRRGISFTGTLRRDGEGYRFASTFDLDRRPFAIRRHDGFDWTTRDDIRVMIDLQATRERVFAEEVEP
jgi:polyisoprenoid-binding protein YceI